jgi:hypothetical protein
MIYIINLDIIENYKRIFFNHKKFQIKYKEETIIKKVSNKKMIKILLNKIKKNKIKIILNMY